MSSAATAGSRVRRPMECTGPRPLAVSVNQRSNTATGINTLTCVFMDWIGAKEPSSSGRPSLRTATSRHGSNTTEDRKKKAPQ